MEIGACRLCRADRPLCQSHVHPRFVARWLRRTGATQFLRMPEMPNRATKDFPRRRLLCVDCEQTIGRLEAHFSKRVFHPVWTSYHPIVGVDEEIRRFAVSLSWRQLVVALEDGVILHPTERERARRREASWRSYLRRERNRAGEHHLFMLKVVAGFGFDDEDLFAINWYLHRSVDGTFVRQKGPVSAQAFVYTKLPGFVVVSPLWPSRLALTAGTELVPGHLIDLRQARVGSPLRRFIFQRGMDAHQRVRRLTARQEALTAERYSAAGDHWEHSIGHQLAIAQGRFQRQAIAAESCTG